jgi:hypothetical protein
MPVPQITPDPEIEYLARIQEDPFPVKIKIVILMLNVIAIKLE